MTKKDHLNISILKLNSFKNKVDKPICSGLISKTARLAFVEKSGSN